MKRPHALPVGMPSNPLTSIVLGPIPPCIQDDRGTRRVHPLAPVLRHDGHSLPQTLTGPSLPQRLFPLSPSRWLAVHLNEHGLKGSEVALAHAPHNDREVAGHLEAGRQFPDGTSPGLLVTEIGLCARKPSWLSSILDTPHRPVGVAGGNQASPRKDKSLTRNALIDPRRDRRGNATVVRR